MTTRKQFIAAAASVPLIGAAPPSAQPASPTPSPAPKKKQISAAARALAEQMRSFDSALSDKEIETIASGIDDNLKVGARVNPHGTTLKNWDEPVTMFEVQP
jgi:hypothetical protein